MCYTGQHSKFVVVVVALSLYHQHQHNQHHELTEQTGLVGGYQYHIDKKNIFLWVKCAERSYLF